MRYRAWVAVAAALTGLAAPAVGQPSDLAPRPDPSGFLLPPVASPAVPLRPSKPPADPGPIRRASAEDYGDDMPPPRPSSSSEPLRPIPPAAAASRSRPAPPRDYDDDYYPPPSPTRRSTSTPRYDDYDTPPPPKRSASSRGYDDDYYPPPAPKKAPPRNYDDYQDPGPTPKKAPPRNYDDDYYPPLAPKKAPPRNYDDYQDPGPAPAPKKASSRDYDDLPPPRAAKMSRPSDVRQVSSQDVEDARAADDRRPPPMDPIEYLFSGGNSRSKDDVYQTTGLFGGGGMTDVLGDPDAGHGKLRSDHCFDTFVSPITNPFLFEDPRSLTEIRPIFIYQNVPTKEPVLGGGSLWFLGMQGRVAFTDRLSLVFNKFGAQGIDPKNDWAIPDHTGLAELWLGPKYTFLRNTETGALMAGGLQFQIPLGSSSVYQDTGSLSVVPYFSYAQNFLRSRSGSFNGLLGTGYSFSTNSERSNYYYLSAHLDYDVGGKHRFYPVTEMNWFYYTKNGTSEPFRFEGRDLINFGSQASGSNLLTWAFGARAKVFKSSEFGFAYEFPLSGNRELFSSRWTLDFIWRY